MTTLYTRLARSRAAAGLLARLVAWTRRAGRLLAQTCIDGHEHSPRAAWLTDLLGRLGAALRRVRAWVEGER